MVEVNWDLLGKPADVFGHFQEGFKTAKSVRDDAYKGSVLSALANNPNDAGAINALASLDPTAATAVQSLGMKRADVAREDQARSALSGWMLGQGGAAETPTGASPTAPAKAQLQEPPTVGDPNWEAYVHADPSGAMKTLLGKHQLTKAQNEAMTSQMDLMARLARSAVDQPSYDAALQQAREAGLDTSSLPTEFDPARVNSIELQALSAKEHLGQQRQDRQTDWNIEDDQIDNTRADRNVDSQIGHREGQLTNTRRGQNMADARGRRGQDLTDARVRGSAGYLGRGGRGGGASAVARAVDPKTGHTIVVKGGRWVDEATGQPVG